LTKLLLATKASATFMEPWLASIITAFEPLVKSLCVLLLLVGELALAGCVVTAFLPTSFRYRLSLPELILPGLFVAVSFAEAWSLFGGVTPWANPVLVLILAILASTRWRVFRVTLGDSVRSTRWRNLILLLPCLVIAAMNALTNGFCYDTLLYHLAAIRWVAEFGSVPGLANLHGRLGFNTALHPLVALFGSPFGIAVGREFVNPVIVVSVCAVLLQSVGLRRKEFFAPDSVYACLLFPLILTLLFSFCLSSPQPDIASGAVAVLVVWNLRRVIQENAGDQEATAYFSCLSASALVVMFKLSYAVLGFAAVGLATMILLHRRRSVILIVASVIVAGLLCIPWLCRGYIISGYPLFPSGIGRIHFDWMVPREAALSEQNWILSWAREPGPGWQSVLASNDWFRSWVVTAVTDPMVWKPLLLFAAGLVLTGSTTPWRYRKDSFIGWCWLISPAILSLFFWFFSAPNPRFAQTTLWVVGADMVYLPFACMSGSPRFLRLAFVFVIAGFTLVELKQGLVRLYHEKGHFPNYVGGTAPLVPRLTYSGLTVWVPAEGDLTGPWQIPATPTSRFDPRLELRGKTLREGFKINRSWRKPPMW
jgi:hypothetical protein